MTQATTKSGDRDHLLSNKVYDWLKVIVTLLLPGVGTLYYAIASIWGLAYGEEIVGTIAAVTVFLGIVIKIGDRSYSNSEAKYDGTMDIYEDDEKKTYSLDLNVSPEELDEKGQVVFRVYKF